LKAKLLFPIIASTIFGLKKTLFSKKDYLAAPGHLAILYYTPCPTSYNS